LNIGLLFFSNTNGRTAFPEPGSPEINIKLYNPFWCKIYFRIKDAQDNIYVPIATNTRVEGFQPNLEKKFYYVFEIPKSASGLKFFVKDNTKVIKAVNLEK